MEELVASVRDMAPLDVRSRIDELRAAAHALATIGVIDRSLADDLVDAADAVALLRGHVWGHLAIGEAHRFYHLDSGRSPSQLEAVMVTPANVVERWTHYVRTCSASRWGIHGIPAGLDLSAATPARDVVARNVPIDPAELLAACPDGEREVVATALREAGIETPPRGAWSSAPMARSQPHRTPARFAVAVRGDVGDRRVAVSAFADEVLHIWVEGVTLGAMVWLRCYGDIHRQRGATLPVAFQTWAVHGGRFESGIDVDLPTTLVVADRGAATEIDLW